MYHKAGFTLLDMLVVLIIVVVLVLVAVPQYKHAVLKSRYTALSPIAQHLKTAQEAYYMGNDYYSEDLNALDLDVSGTITSATTASYGGNMRVQISTQEDEEEEYSYVLASKEGLNNNYIMYQEHSKNYPGEIHCEAKNGDSYAQWLCEKGLSGQKIEQGSITPGYTTYVISGSGNGTFLKECTAEKELEDSSCACGKRTRVSTGCDEKTGEWIYGEWSSCPVKPDETKACSALDSKWTSGTATRESQCNGNSWTEPEWDTTDCEIACKEEEKEATKACACGTQTAGTVTCNTKTGKWEYSNWSECPVKPKEELDCESGVNAKMTRSVTCQDNAWTEPAWDKHLCCNPNDTNKPSDQYICHDHDGETCGIKTRSVTCNSNGQWVADDNAWQGNCIARPSSQGEQCGSSYTNTSANITLTHSCSAEGAWTVSQEDTSACGCVVADKPKEELDCESGVNAKMTRTVTCQGTTWTDPAWDKHLCCDPNDSNKPSDQYICHDSNTNQCGIRTRSVTCNTNGQWVADDNGWSGSCIDKPANQTVACTSGYTGTRTRKASSCTADNTAWKWGSYDTKSCCANSSKPGTTASCTDVMGDSYCGTITYTVTCTRGTKSNGGIWTQTEESNTCTTSCCDNNNKPATTASCSSVLGSSYCGTITYSVTCGRNASTNTFVWTQTETSNTCTTANSSQLSALCGSSYTNPNASKTRTASCTNNTWKYSSSWDYSACGCNVNEPMRTPKSIVDSSCEWGYAWLYRTTCSGSSWQWGNKECATSKEDACVAKCTLGSDGIAICWGSIKNGACDCPSGCELFGER